MTRPEPPLDREVRHRVLVCDDDPLIRESIVEILADEFDVETTSRAVDAIRRIMRTRYAALVLDLNLPGLGGLDAVSTVQRLDMRLPIVVITGYASFEVERAVREKGVFYYLVKPFTVDELSAAVRAAARSRNRGSTSFPPPRR